MYGEGTIFFSNMLCVGVIEFALLLDDFLNAGWRTIRT